MPLPAPGQRVHLTVNRSLHVEPAIPAAGHPHGSYPWASSSPRYGCLVLGKSPAEVHMAVPVPEVTELRHDCMHALGHTRNAFARRRWCAAQSVSSCHFGVQAISHWKPSGSAM
jgi:hypothetical protein